MHRRSRAARLAVAALGLSIVTSMLAVIPAFAGDTRDVVVGSVSGTTISKGVLTATTVSAGEAFLVSVRVLNNGQQNINNVQLQIGRDGEPLLDESYPVAPDPIVTPVFPVAFDDGTVVTDIVAGDDKCGPDTVPVGVGPVVCDVGTLRRGRHFTATLLITTTSDSDDLSLKATVKVSENANDSGANTDTFAAEGIAAVQAPSCTGLFGYLPAGQFKQLDTTDFLGTSGCVQAIDLLVREGQTTNDAVIFADLIEDTAEGQHCVASVTCFGNAFEISVNGGAAVNDYFEVTLVWNDLPDGFTINKAGVVHNGQLIEATKKFECSAKKVTDCWFESVVSGDSWTFSIRLEQNGFIRGKG